MIIALLAVALTTASPEAPGPEARSAGLDQVFPFWTDYLSLAEDQRDAFDLDYVLEAPLRGDGSTYRFWVETGDGGFAAINVEQPVTPPSADAFEQGLRLFTDAPRGAVSVEMRLTLPEPTRAEYTLAELETALAQAGGAMRRSMGIRSLFMPRLDTVRFSFSGVAPAAYFVDEDGGQTEIMDVFETEILVTPGDRTSRNAVSIRFEQAPRAAILITRN
jgi:hypothetical protein